MWPWHWLYDIAEFEYAACRYCTLGGMGLGTVRPPYKANAAIDLTDRLVWRIQDMEHVGPSTIASETTGVSPDEWQ